MITYIFIYTKGQVDTVETTERFKQGFFLRFVFVSFDDFVLLNSSAKGTHISYVF